VNCSNCGSQNAETASACAKCGDLFSAVPWAPPLDGGSYVRMSDVTEARVVEAIQRAVDARSFAAEAVRIADVAEADALLKSNQSSDAKRKAEATLASAQARADAEKAKARAFGASALVEFHLTHRRDFGG
jgi:predicted  nucleic acid-binding Zn-ribbon protein